MSYFGTALITGCGGDVACALARIARRAGLFGRLLGCDLREDHDGLEIFDRCHVIPRADDPAYFERLAAVAAAESVDLIVPCSDVELGAFHAAGYGQEFGGREVLMASPRAVAVGLDKLKTAEFLSQHGFAHPWTLDAAQHTPVAYPCIYKPRQGQGGKGFRFLGSAADLDPRGYDSGIFQQYLPGEDAEFTSGLYRSAAGEVRHITFRRKLSGGLTASGVVESTAEISAFLERLAGVLDLAGSINIQFRLQDNVPYVFEINPRFSSTVRFRDRLGFRDFVWSVQERAGSAIAPLSPARPGIRFKRGIEEIVYD